MNILLADDHIIVRQGLQYIIEEILQETNFYFASSISSILNIVETKEIHAAIIDAQYPDGNCMSILSQIKELNPTLKIMIFTSFEEDVHALNFLKAGADGFLSKTSDEESIKEALTDFFEKGFYHSPLTQQLLKLSEFNAELLNPFQLLSNREMEITKLLAQGLGNLEIANQIQIKQNTVSTYKNRIFEKLKCTTLLELIQLYNKYHAY